MTFAEIPLILLASLVVAGCAAKAGPDIDPTGVDMALYEKDLAQCETVARKSRPQAGEQVLGGAAMSSAENSDGEDPVTVEQCLQARGYRLLN